jgi:cell division protein FtsA
MNFDKVITSIDIWSNKIRTVIWSFLKEEENNFIVLGVWEADSSSIRKWNILDMEAFKDDLDKSLLEAEKMSGEQVNSAYISFNSSSFDVIVNKWITATHWEEVSSWDVDRVLEMAKNWAHLPNKYILKVVPESFNVDLEQWVKNPIWMSARKIEVIAHIFTMNSNVLSNMKKAIMDVWIEIIDIYPNILTASEGILTKRQKELWVVLIDIWAATTWVSVYEEWVLIHSWIIPFGWDNVTNDIALWVRVSIDVAEKLKKEYCILESKEVSVENKNVSLSNVCETEEGEVNLEYLSQIATARYEEILEFVNNHLQTIGKQWMLPEWAVLVWWGAKEKWLIELSKDILKLPSFIWIPTINDELVDKNISDPSYVAIIWNMILANKYWDDGHKFNINFAWILSSIKKLLKKIMPK